MAEQSDHSNNPGGNKRKLGYLQLVVIIAVIVVALVLARAPERISQQIDSQADNRPNPVVSVIQPEASVMSLPIKLTGNVSFAQKVEIVSQAKGRVVWVSENFAAGRTISANEPIIRIDPTQAQLRVDEAQALLDIEQREQQLSTEVDATLAASKMKLLQARLDLAQNELSQTEISKPFAFQVIGADVEIGDLVGPQEYVGRESSVLGRGYRLESLQIGAAIDPKLIKSIGHLLGKPATVKVADEIFGATIDRVSAVVNRDTRLSRIFLKFNEDHDPESLPRPGMFAEIELTGPAHDNVFVLPHSALQAGSTVWVVENGRLSSRTPNSIGYTNSGWMVESFDTASGIVSAPIPNAIAGTEVTVSN